MSDKNKKKKTAMAPSKRELVAIARFDSPWANNSEEVNALDSGKWNPSKNDFAAVANKDAKSKDIFTIKTLGEFLGVISEAKDGTLERLVLITHSTNNLIALSGTMAYNGEKGKVGLNQSNKNDMINSGGIDQRVVNWLNEDPTGIAQRNLARTKFTENAEIVLISCHSGSFASLPPFLMDLSASLNVRIRGFNEEIGYFPRYNKNAVTDRTFTAVSLTGTQAKGYRHLLSNSAIKSFKAKTPAP